MPKAATKRISRPSILELAKRLPPLWNRYQRLQARMIEAPAESYAQQAADHLVNVVLCKAMAIKGEILARPPASLADAAIQLIVAYSMNADATGEAYGQMPRALHGAAKIVADAAGLDFAEIEAIIATDPAIRFASKRA